MAGSVDTVSFGNPLDYLPLTTKHLHIIILQCVCARARVCVDGCIQYMHTFISCLHCD